MATQLKEIKHWNNDQEIRTYIFSIMKKYGEIKDTEGIIILPISGINNLPPNSYLVWDIRKGVIMKKIPGIITISSLRSLLKTIIIRFPLAEKEIYDKNFFSKVLDFIITDADKMPWETAVRDEEDEMSTSLNIKHTVEAINKCLLPDKQKIKILVTKIEAKKRIIYPYEKKVGELRSSAERLGFGQKYSYAH